MLQIGDTAPSFCLLNSDNKEVCLENYEGKWVVLYFYPKDQSPGCTKQACDFTASLSSFQELNAEILGISADSPESHQKFRKKKQLDIILLSDEKFEVIDQYGASNRDSFIGKIIPFVKRQTFLINPEGKIAYIWEKVNVIGHIANVKEVIEGLSSEIKE